MNPNTKLNFLTLPDFMEVFQKEIEDFCTYKGINLDEEKLAKMLSLMHTLTRNKFHNLVVNDVTIAVGNLYFEDVKKVTPEILIKALQNASNKKSIQEEHEENETYKCYEWNSEHGRALVLRVTHDPGGHILKQNGHTYKDVVEAVKQGYNYYTGDKVVVVTPDHVLKAINKNNY